MKMAKNKNTLFSCGTTKQLWYFLQAGRPHNYYNCVGIANPADGVICLCRSFGPVS